MMAPAVFGGRWDELHLLSQLRDQAIEGKPQIILIEGDPGLGKTALLGAVATTRQPHRKQIRTFLVVPPAAGRYDPVHEAALVVTNKQLYDRVGGRGEAQDLLFDWMGAVPGWGDLVAAISATAEALRRRRRRQPASPLSTDEDIDALLAAADRPLALLFDDLHLADAAAVARLEAMIRAAGEGAKLLVVGTCSATAPGLPEPPIYTMLKALPAGMARRHKLRALTPKELEIWLGKVFPRAVKSPDFVDWLFASTGGHPATVQSTLDHLLQRSVIRFVNKHWEIDSDPGKLDLPATGEGELADLSGVSESVAEVVRVASVLGEEFDSVSLSRLLDRDELYVEDQLATGVHHQLLAVTGEIDLPDGDIATAYRFATPQLRAALYNGVPAEYRSQLEQRLNSHAALP